ncbi:hypothetical protein ACFLQY_02375 [Verrucomicrobiota bacterium]
MTLNSDTPIMAASMRTEEVYGRGTLAGSSKHFYAGLIIDECYRLRGMPKHGEFEARADTAREAMDELAEQLSPFFSGDVIVEEDTTGTLE